MSVKAFFKLTQTQYQQFRECLYVTVYTLCHVLTLSRVSKLSTHHSGITTAPGVITHSAPHIVHTDLHSALIGNVTTNQSQLTSCARSCVVSKIMDKKQTTNKYKNIVTHKFVTTFPPFLHQHSCTQIINVPSQPTPASSECWQLWVKIGLLEHSNSWLELELHWTSSRKIGPVPAPNRALLYPIPPNRYTGQSNQLALTH